MKEALINFNYKSLMCRPLFGKLHADVVLCMSILFHHTMHADLVPCRHTSVITKAGEID